MRNTMSPTLGADAVRGLMQKELSFGARVGYTVLLLTGLAAAGLIGSLWLTEPGPLPTATHVAFGLIVAINLSWAAFAAWVLSQRKVLYAKDRVMAGWMAVVFCAVFLVFGLAIAVQRGNASAQIVIAALGAAQLIVAIAVLIRAKRRRRELLARRDDLRKQLTGA